MPDVISSAGRCGNPPKQNHSESFASQRVMNSMVSDLV